ncbi:hypothetical protein [Agromyces sp. NPDC058110]|uniref:hypothetical protein n=1 Tax=Agromyces sp. NPDC058110 TaxID=3346345 RepID=UPI0036DC3073
MTAMICTVASERRERRLDEVVRVGVLRALRDEHERARVGEHLGPPRGHAGVGGALQGQRADVVHGLGQVRSRPVEFRDAGHAGQRGRIGRLVEPELAGGQSGEHALPAVGGRQRRHEQAARTPQARIPRAPERRSARAQAEADGRQVAARHRERGDGDRAPRRARAFGGEARAEAQLVAEDHVPRAIGPGGREVVGLPGGGADEEVAHIHEHLRRALAPAEVREGRGLIVLVEVGRRTPGDHLGPGAREERRLGRPRVDAHPMPRLREGRGDGRDRHGVAVEGHRLEHDVDHAASSLPVPRTARASTVSAPDQVRIRERTDAVLI